MPLQVAFETQGTHVAVAALHAGVVPVHALAFVVEHAPHVPPGWQAGVEPPQSASEPQARHMCVPVSHVGLAAVQSEFATQGTQVAVVALQTGVAPEHCVRFVGEQTPHVPFGSQAGVAPPHSASL